MAHEIDGLGISAITASELYWGVCKSSSVRNKTTLEKFLSPLTIVDYDLSAVQHYGELRAYLEKQGTPIGPLDQQIAAHALTPDITLATSANPLACFVTGRMRLRRRHEARQRGVKRP